MAITHDQTMEHGGSLRTRIDAGAGSLKDIVAQVPAALAVLGGSDHHFTHVNELFVGATGRAEVRDFLGIPVREALPELETCGGFEFLDEVYRTGTTYRGRELKVSLHQSPAGSEPERYFDFTFQPVFDSAGGVEGILVLAVDATERVAIHQALEEREARFRLAQQATEIGTWEWDPGEDSSTLSPETHRIYGTDPNASAEEIYRVWSARVHPSDWPQVNLEMAECQKRGVLDIEYRYQHPEMGLRHHHAKGRRMLGTSRFFGVVDDITGRKRVEQSLSKREEDFRGLADAMPQLVWMSDPDGYIHWFNQRWYDYTGTTAEQNCGWGWQSVHDPKFLPEVVARWKGSLRSGEPFEMVFPLRGKEGQYKPFLTRAVPVRDAGGRDYSRWFGTNTDISGEFEIRQPN